MLQHAMKIVKNVLERILKLVKVDAMQFFFYSRQRKNRCIVVRIMLQECYEKEGKLYMHFANIEKAFGGIPRIVKMLAIRKKGLSDVILRVVVSLHHEAKTKVRVGS